MISKLDLPIFREKTKHLGAKTSRCFGYEYLLAALDGKETVAWVFVNYKASGQFRNCLWTLVLAEVVNLLQLAAAECYFL
jgi:hypothetical protein